MKAGLEGHAVHLQNALQRTTTSIVIAHAAEVPLQPFRNAVPLDSRTALEYQLRVPWAHVPPLIAALKRDADTEHPQVRCLVLVACLHVHQRPLYCSLARWGQTAYVQCHSHGLCFTAHQSDA